MGALDRLKNTRLGRKLLRDPEPEVPPTDVIDGEGNDGGEGPDGPDGPGGKSGIAGWVEERAHSVVSKIYETRADDIEDRAKRAVSSVYKDQADDLESRAVRAMRRAISEEADRIKEVIEHGVQVKKREVRLSLLVLIVAAVVYLALDYFTRGGAAPQ